MFKHSLPSIEQFAAFLDGNLSQSEMQQFSHLAEHDMELHQLLDANTLVDNTLASFTDSDLQLPSEISGFDFVLPQIPENGISQFVNLSPEPTDDMIVAASGADEDSSIFSCENQEVHITLDDGINNESSFTMPDNNGFDNSDDLSNSFSDDI